MRRLILIALLAAACPAAAQSVVDGDTLKLNGTTYRLWGIDAPEGVQLCGDWHAGSEATRALASLMHGRAIVCEPKATDRYGRTVALCRADGVDLGAEMVRRGMAWAFVRYSHDYVPQEAAAKREGKGVHAYACIPAWEWRVRNR
jgi:endonuclease YncB( thermonuclease family)